MKSRNMGSASQSFKLCQQKEVPFCKSSQIIYIFFFSQFQFYHALDYDQNMVEYVFYHCLLSLKVLRNPYL